MLHARKDSLNHSHTENGAVAAVSTQSHCLDLFATIGALRHNDQADVAERFQRAYTENPDLAMKLLFFARDERGGLGEHRVFRIVLRHLAAHYGASVVKNISAISEMGSWDDLLVLLGTPCEQAALAYIKTQWDADVSALAQGGDVSLLGKGLPSINTSSTYTVAQAKIIAQSLNLSNGDYRKGLSKLRKQLNLMEIDLREEGETEQPSKTMVQEDAPPSYAHMMEALGVERYKAIVA